MFLLGLFEHRVINHTAVFLLDCSFITLIIDSGLHVNSVIFASVQTVIKRPSQQPEMRLCNPTDACLSGRRVGSEFWHVAKRGNGDLQSILEYVVALQLHESLTMLKERATIYPSKTSRRPDTGDLEINCIVSARLTHL